MSAARTECSHASSGSVSWRSAEQGFTLIEMLVALAIFSLAALALLRLGGATATNSARLNDQAIAKIVARNLAVETLTDPQPPAFGASAGEVGQCRPALALDAHRRPLARGAHPADRDRGRARSRRPRPRPPHPLPAGPRMRRSTASRIVASRRTGLHAGRDADRAGDLRHDHRRRRRLAHADRADAGDARSGCSIRSARCGGPAPCSAPISARRRRASTATATAGRCPPSPAALAADGAAARRWCGAAGRTRARSARRCSGSNIGSREGRLERWRYDAVDGEGRATAMTLLDDVRSVRLRYRDREGIWRATLGPDRSRPAAGRGRAGQRQRRPGRGPPALPGRERAMKRAPGSASAARPCSRCCCWSR